MSDPAESGRFTDPQTCKTHRYLEAHEAATKAKAAWERAVRWGGELAKLGGSDEAKADAAAATKGRLREYAEARQALLVRMELLRLTP